MMDDFVELNIKLSAKGVFVPCSKQDKKEEPPLSWLGVCEYNGLFAKLSYSTGLKGLGFIYTFFILIIVAQEIRK